MRKIKIERGWFRSAGHKYKWLEDKYHIFGVGINLIELKNHKELAVEIDNNLYILDSEEAWIFAKKYNATYVAGKTRLAIISRSLLREAEPKTKTEMLVEVNPQQKLF